MVVEPHRQDLPVGLECVIVKRGLVAKAVDGARPQAAPVVAANRVGIIGAAANQPSEFAARGPDFENVRIRRARLAGEDDTLAILRPRNG